jgi:hypothetical protein
MNILHATELLLKIKICLEILMQQAESVKITKENIDSQHA